MKVFYLVIAIIITLCLLVLTLLQLGVIGNLPPSKPKAIYPLDGAYGLNEKEISLMWRCNDPNDDMLSYTVFAKSDQGPEKVIIDKTIATSVEIITIDYYSTYYWRVVAHDGKRDKLSDWFSFSHRKKGKLAVDSLLDARDNKLYPFITIGKQIWMSKNLAYIPQSAVSSPAISHPLPPESAKDMPISALEIYWDLKNNPDFTFIGRYSESLLSGKTN